MSAHNRVHHYENFPVASWLLPRHCVPAVTALYRFARTADDIADEGDADSALRLQLLNTLDLALDAPRLAHNRLISDLALFIEQGIMPIDLLRQLLSAFKQDVHLDEHEAHLLYRFANLADLIDYCTRSANPVGRLMLLITQSARNLAQANIYSDQVCTSLQLINFWQDIAKDALNGRCYIPYELYLQYGQPSSVDDPKYRKLLGFLHHDARTRMLNGAPLLGLLSGRFRAEIALTIAAGLRVLDLLGRFPDKPVKLSWVHAPAIFIKAVRLMTQYPARPS